MGKNNLKKQGSFFQSLFQVPSFNIRDVRANSADEEAFRLAFWMSREVSCHISVVKSDNFQTASENAAAILTGMECKYMSFCLVFSILPNFYEIKANFPQSYNVYSVFRQRSIDGNSLVKRATTHWKLPTDRKGYYIDGYALVCLCSFSYNRSTLFLVVFTGNVCGSHLEITLLIQIVFGMNF